MNEFESFDASVVEHAADAIVVADVRGKILRWNRAATTLFGFTAQEAIGSSLDLIIPERLRKAHWIGFDRAIASGATRLGGKPTVTRALRRTGERLYVDMSFALVLDAAGAVVGSVAIARDATARVEADKARQAPSA